MNTERNVINFKEIFSLIFRRLWLIILFALLGGVIAFCVSEFLIDPKYEAHVNLYVQSDSPLLASGSSNSQSSGDNKSDVGILKQLTNTYIEVLNDDLVMQEMGRELVERFGYDIISKVFTVKEDNIPADELRDTIFIESVPDTLVLKLKVITKDPEVSVAICNYFAVYSDIYLQKAIGNGCKAQYMAWAKYNDTPVSPDKLKNTVLGAISAILFALLLIFVIDFFDDSVRDITVISNRYKKAVIGEVEHFKGVNKYGKKNTRFVSILDKYIPFTVIENYKAIRTSLIYTLSSYQSKVIAISSAEPYEGKSVTAANLAITLAHSGNRVLLIEADLRSPVQHLIFGITSRKGLAHALTNIYELDNCINKTFVEKLDIITAGSATANASELVSSYTMNEIIDEVRDNYDYILVDTPAVNPFTDSIDIAKKVSGMIMVVKYNETKSSDIDSAMSRIEFFETNMIGFIFNDVKRNKKYNKVMETARDVIQADDNTQQEGQNNLPDTSKNSNNVSINQNKNR